MSRAFFAARIAKTEALIEVYEDALAALGAEGGVQSYSIDTGQSRQNVTRADVPSINRMLDTLYNRLATLEARVHGGSTVARPDW